jgi:LPS export ABC transporter protein LptC
MLKDPRNLLWIAPLAVLVTLPLWKPLAENILSPARRQTGAAALSLAAKAVKGSSAMEGVEFEQRRNGTREWRLTAGRMVSAENDPDMLLEDVKGAFFGKAGKREEARVKSRKGTYNTETRQITLAGDILIEDAAGYEMRTDSLDYLAAEQTMRTTAPVTIRGSNIEVSGNRLLYDIGAGKYLLEGNVVCRVW